MTALVEAIELSVGEMNRLIARSGDGRSHRGHEASPSCLKSVFARLISYAIVIQNKFHRQVELRLARPISPGRPSGQGVLDGSRGPPYVLSNEKAATITKRGR